MSTTTLNTIDGMEIRGKLLPEEIKEAGGFLRSKWYWPKLLLRSWYGGLLFLALLWGTVAKALSGDHEHWAGLSVVWLVVISIVGWAFLSTRRSQLLASVALNESLPDLLTMTDEGISTWSGNGQKAFLPWTALTSWYNGTRVLFLSILGTRGLLIPLSDLDAADQRVLRDTVQAHLGKPQ